MRILVDGRVLRHRTISGVERYTDLLIKHLAKRKELELHLIKPDSKGRIAQHIWEHFCLPLKALEYDLLFCPANVAPIWVPEGVRLVVTLHSVAYLLPNNSYSKLFRRYYKTLIPHIIEIANHIVTVSEAEKKRIVHFYPSAEPKISVIHNGIDEKFIQQREEGEKYILSVISHLSAKNMSSMISAFNLIRDRIEEDLKIVVSDPNRPENAISRFSERITIYYNLSDEMLINMYRRASLFVMPSTYESFCFPVFEAIASSLPVVCTPLEAVKEIAGDAVYYSAGFDAESISHSIFSVLKNPLIREGLLRHREEVLSRLKWEIAVDKYVSLFKKVLMTNEG